MTRRAFVTGGTGFVGTHLIRHLSSCGYDVRAIRRAPSESPLAEVEWIVGDLSDVAALRAGAQSVDVVFNLAAAVGGSALEPEELVKVASIGTRNVLEAAIAGGAERVVHVSSEAVYDPSAPNPVTESSPLVEDVDGAHPYVRQKLLAEEVVWRADTTNEIAVTCIRPARVIGPGDPNLLGVMDGLFGAAMGTIVDDSAAHVPVVVVEELVTALEQAAVSSTAAHRCYNLASKTPITKGELRAAFVDAGFRPSDASTGKRTVVAGLASAMKVARAVGRRSGDGETWGSRHLADVVGGRLGGSTVDRIYSSDQATADFGWAGSADVRDAIARAVQWGGAQR